MAKPQQRFSGSEHSLRRSLNQSPRNLLGSFCLWLGCSNVEGYLRVLPCSKIQGILMVPKTRFQPPALILSQSWGGSFRAPPTHPKPRRRAFRAPLPVIPPPLPVIPNRSREESKIHPHQPVCPRIVRRNFPTTTIKRPCAKIKSPLRQAPAFDILEPRCPRALFLFAWGCSSFGRALQWH